ncbi:MAG: VPLPA-CTERM sorting domain-containing protein [bacterium]|jgi:hypothetical protein|nr:VPLPA-CTERM sorting domain-containing protein [Betaproteobacteria bacterium]
MLRRMLFSMLLAAGLAAPAGDVLAALAYTPIFASDGPGQTSNGHFARNQFLGMVSGAGTETFESRSGGTPLAIDFAGTPVSVTATITGAGRVSTDTTSGVRPISGERFYSVVGGAGPGGSLFTVTFSTPVTAFAFFMTDPGDWGGQLSLEIERALGGTAPLLVPNTLFSGPVESGRSMFVGLRATEIANAISAIRFRVVDADGGIAPEPVAGVASMLDEFGFDDMMVASIPGAVLGSNLLPPTPIPLPAGAWLLLAGLGMLGTLARRARR